MNDPNGRSTPLAPGSQFDAVLPQHLAAHKAAEPADLADRLDRPYLPRANLAVSDETPDGTPGWREQHKDLSVLQQHCLFWDRDLDGVIWPLDTFRGFHQLGYHIIWCVMSVFLIHSSFSYFTNSSWIPDPFFRVYLPTIHRAKHGSDTGSYDTEGRFVPAKFAAIFSKYDEENKGGLTFSDGLRMIYGNRGIADPIGWIAAFFEWFATYLLWWPEDGLVTKEMMRTTYDGSAFFLIAEQRKKEGFYSAPDNLELKH
ncbi:Caleosin [Phaffia rhodozyma]|uniref:Caleosin n=1 Tax=Phaffia rhodozyma TaxID=264483 RepID=A0A0F7SIC3_PHARH|nr:Caleosin [Phaffia rhodozyma]